MRLLPRFLRGGGEPRFVSARPGLAEFFLEFHYGSGVGRWLRLFWGFVALPFRIVWRLLAWAASLVGSLFAGGFRGLQQRRVRHLLQGLPSIAALGAVVTTAVLAFSQHDTLPNDYRRLAAARFAEKDWNDARLYYERLFRLEGGSAESRLLLGYALAEMGDHDEAWRLIGGVASGDAEGDPRANHWVASQILAEPDNWRDHERMIEAGRHLLIAERGLPGDVRIQLDLANYYLALGQPSAAVPKLAAAAVTKPELALDLAKVYASLGQMTSAKTELIRASDHFREVLKSEPADRDTRLMLSASLVNLGRLDDAVAVLREGLAIDSQGPYGPAIARVCIAAYDRLALQRSRNYPGMLSVLREALRYDPQSAEATARLVSFGESVSAPSTAVTAMPDPEIDAAARELLQEMLARGEPPAPVHMALGVKAWRSEDLETAAWHFERAYDLEPSLAGVANNLAWVLAHQSQPDFDRALATIAPVVERFPDVPQFRDTRGEIYLRQERWDEALSDLERALPSMRNNPRIHESLALVYEQLGRDEIARRHRSEAARLQPAREVTAAKLLSPTPSPPPQAEADPPTRPQRPVNVVPSNVDEKRQPIEAPLPR